MKVYTKKGDQGKTSLIGGTKVDKSNLRIEAYGTVDELNAHLGLQSDYGVNKQRIQFIRDIQNNLFSIGSFLALEDQSIDIKIDKISDEDISQLEIAIDEMSNELPEMKNFILPGGAIEISSCHLARTVCRRAERRVVELARREKIDPKIIIYLNRLSDYLFVLCRKITLELGVDEIIWNPK